MARPSKLSLMKERLLSRRNQIFETHRELRQDRETLRQPEPEYEETAQKEDISDVLSRLDSREKEELEHIDEVLGRIEAGSYGICQSCGKKISPKRLEAIPWQTLCRACERKREKEGGPSTLEEEMQQGPSAAPEGLTDEEILETISNTFREDDRVETDELEITCKKGVVYLRGFLPSEAKRQILLQIIQDTLGFQNVVDEVLIDPLLWERKDRTTGEKADEAEVESVLSAAEEGDLDISKSMDLGPEEDEPMTPPDEWVPDDEKSTD